MKPTPVLHADPCPPLTRAIQVVRKNLEGDKQTQQLARATVRDRAEQDGAVDVGALALDRLQRVGAERHVGNRVSAGAPTGDLARSARQSPGQLAPRCAYERDRRLDG